MTPSAPDASRHRCLVYDGDPSEHLPVVIPMLADALREGRRCLYLGEPAMVEAAKAALAERGVDVPAEIRRGALVLSSDRGHLADGRFDPDAMVASLEAAIDQAVRDGFVGLYATGDMRWELGGDENFARLREYEAKLELVFRQKPLSGVCQYRREAVPPSAVEDALRAHKTAWVGGQRLPDNMFYVPPELVLDGPPDGRRAEWLWEQVRRVVRAQQERDDSYRALERLNGELESRVKERTADLEAFSYSVSHDLRAPLRTIAGFSSILLEDQGPALGQDGRASLGKVVDASRRMAALIDGLQELFRLSRQQLEPVETDLSALAAAAVEDLRVAAPARDADVLIQPSLKALGDPRLLGTALANLLGNAWKFTAKAPVARIEFGARAETDGLVYFVRDNGAGFDMAFAEKLFHPFQRLHSAAEFPGTGIGLATTRRVIQRHGGRIWAESAPGKGTSVFFTLGARA